VELTTVRSEQLEPYVADVFKATGMATEDARLMARILVTADLRGVHTHGVSFVPTYVNRLLDPNGIDPRGRPSVVSDSGSALVVDAGNAMGHVAAHFSMEQAIGRAKETGVAAVAVRGSNHCGAMAYYPMQALPEDMIGIAMTGALPSMAAWGGLDQILGNNPIAAAIPALQEKPIVVDVAFQATFPLKIRLWQERGWPIPEDWSFDAEGRPTTDPVRALEGWGQPVGKYKGVALALLTGALSVLLSGAAWGRELGNMTDGPMPGQDGHFFLAVNVSAFGDPETFKRRVDGIIGEIHSSRRAADIKRILLPGERAAEAEEHGRAEGIALPQSSLTALAETASRLDVQPPVDLSK
jgi:LDH2 family malate/lactate/ureidoglycolate dehydrogenase